ncbi:transposase [Steroidobacter cummioxidans]|uniref:transposase n=1 Tax=Steroidobacter cummioxidans TaxID=1803913 RepID=UPI000E31A4C1|nr:transposase [Steroidobacter cummioxidans]
MDTSAKSGPGDSSVEGTSRRMRTLEERLAIIEEASRPNASVALVARNHGVNAKQVFGWLRLHRSGLLESLRHGKPVPLLPVKIATPTFTPTERVVPSGRGKRRRARTADNTAESMLELVLPDGVRVRLYGAQRLVLDRILNQLPLR